uniref:VHS domain-containing protein n=1 Tax=Pavo cristatus TaxID=9049 RepID=A0A8C9ENB2_PAVCR
MAFGKAPKDPFGTAVGSLVDRATFGSLETEEWGQFMHICDVINATEEGQLLLVPVCNRILGTEELLYLIRKIVILM